MVLFQQNCSYLKKVFHKVLSLQELLITLNIILYLIPFMSQKDRYYQNRKGVSEDDWEERHNSSVNPSSKIFINKGDSKVEISTSMNISDKKENKND